MQNFSNLARLRNIRLKDKHLLLMTGFSHDLRAIGHIDNIPWFVDGALQGEKVQVHALKQHAHRVDAELVAVEQAAAARIKPACEYCTRCGGCDLQHIPHAEQIRLKQQVLLEQLQRLGKVVPAELLPPLFGRAWAYRRRARLACKWSSDKKQLQLGFRARHSREIVEIKHCAVLLPALEALIVPLRDCLAKWSQPRQLGHVELLAADNGVAINLRVMAMPTMEDKAALQAFAATTQAQVYLQTEENAAQIFFAGMHNPFIFSDADSATQYSCVPGDFVQGNAELNGMLINAVSGALAPCISDRVLEAFCGLGNFTWPLAAKVAHITALELHAPMLSRARKQAQALGFEHIDWREVNLENFSATTMKQEKYNKVLLDPPRHGAQTFCQEVDLSAIELMVYVSCNPSTLARDAAILTARGVVLHSVQLVDMFPQTHHMEVVAKFVKPLLKKQKTDVKQLKKAKSFKIR